MNEALLTTRGLRKSFGSKEVLAGLNLTVRRGEVYGFLGRNGAGKTTAIKIILGLSAHDAGIVQSQARAVGFLPDVPQYHPWTRADEFLRYCGRLGGLNGKLLDERVDLMLELSQLSGTAQKIMDFSRGMRQCLGMAQALICAPDLLILDEPTSALDPLGRRDVLDMISALKGQATVLFSTHLLDDAARVCDRVGILHGGSLVTESTVADLTQMPAVGFDVRVAAGGADGEEVTAQRSVDAEKLRRDLASAGWQVERVAPRRRSLEDAFVELTGRAVA